MRLFLTRHGQVCPQNQEHLAFDTSKDDPPLTALGQLQATLLGQEMQRRGFSGRIISSPFTRALMTASCVAQACQLPISIDLRFREIAHLQDGLKGFRGKTLDQMKAEHARIQQDTLPYPWWTEPHETFPEVVARIRPLLDEIIARDEDCLLVGHGATTVAANNILLNLGLMEEEAVYQARNMNCSLSEYLIQDGKIWPLQLYSTGHIPHDLVTSNFRHAFERAEGLCPNI